MLWDLGEHKFEPFESVEHSNFSLDWLGMEAMVFVEGKGDDSIGSNWKVTFHVSFVFCMGKTIESIYDVFSLFISMITSTFWTVHATWMVNYFGCCVLSNFGWICNMDGESFSIHWYVFFGWICNTNGEIFNSLDGVWGTISFITLFVIAFSLRVNVPVIAISSTYDNRFISIFK